LACTRGGQAWQMPPKGQLTGLGRAKGQVWANLWAAWLPQARGDFGREALTWLGFALFS
jgi:hypothetical protein